MGRAGTGLEEACGTLGQIHPLFLWGFILRPQSPGATLARCSSYLMTQEQGLVEESENEKKKLLDAVTGRSWEGW